MPEMSEDGTLSGDGPEEAGRRRRPSGEPPPLVRGIGWQRWAWGLLGVVLLGVLLAIGEATGALTGLDRAVGDAAVDLRTPDAHRRREGRGPPHRRPVDHGPAMGNGHRARGPRALPAPRGVPRDVRGHGLGGRSGAPRSAGTPRCDRARRGGNLRIPVPVDRGARDHADRYLARARPARSRPAGSVVARARGAARRRSGRADPGDRLRHPDGLLVVVRRRPRRDGLPDLRAGGRLPGDAAAWRERRASRPRRRTRGGDRPGDARPARPDRHGRRAVRPGGLGRILPAADDPGRRHPRLREGVLHQPRTRRPLVSRDPGGPVRPAGGRDADGLGAAPRDLRGLCAPLAPRRRGRRRANLRRRRADPEPRVHARHGVLRGRPEPQRLGRGRHRDRRRPRSRSASLGRGVRPSRPEAREPPGRRVATCSSWMSRLWRCGRRRGAKPSTWRT